MPWSKRHNATAALQARVDQLEAELAEHEDITARLIAIERATSDQLDEALRLFDVLVRAVNTWERHAGMDRSVSAHTRSIAQGRLVTRTAELRAQRIALTTPPDQPDPPQEPTP